MIKLITTVAFLAVASVTPVSAYSDAELASARKVLASRAIEALGPQPENYGGVSVTRKLNQQPVRGQKCVKVVVARRDARLGGTFQRWKCD